MKTKSRNLIVVFLMALAMLFSVFAITPLTVFANEPEAEITEVTTFNELLNAVNSDKTYIKLATSITDDVPDDELPTKHRLLFDGGKEYVLDLGPYMLFVRNTCNEFYGDNFSMIGVTNNSKLTILGGSIRFENYYTNSRTCKGVVSVSDTSTLVTEGTNMKNHQMGPVVYAEGAANVTLNGGEYTVQNGFALYMKGNASLTLDDGVYAHTVMGDCAETTFNNGYGALYSESTGALNIEYAIFESGVQVHESQIGAFDVSTHEVVINGMQITENIFVGTYYEAKVQGKEYYWYDFHMRALFKFGEEYSSFVNKVRVISYSRKSPITVENGTATIGGVPVTEACYGQEVTIVADAPEAGKEFVGWAVMGGGVDYPFETTSTFTMPANAIEISACYGNVAISEVNITITPPEVGKIPSMTAAANNHAECTMLEWYLVGHGYKQEENDIFYPSFGYGVIILLYPEADYKFANTVTATVNGENAQVIEGNAGYVKVQYEFDGLPQNPFNVSYKSGYQSGVDGTIELNIDSMKTASNAFNEAFDAEKVSYQWYRDGKTIEGATDSAYTFVEGDVGCYVHCVVTADEMVAYGYTVMCDKSLYKVNFNLTEVVAGGRAPELTSATTGIAVNASSYVICEKYSENSFSNPFDISQMILIPGKTYRIIAFYMIMDPEITVGSNASFYVNGNEAEKDGYRIIYDFTIPAADFDLNVTCEDEIGIGAELVADEITGATYQWYKNGEAIKGATSRSYIVTKNDKVSLIHCVATKENGDYGYSRQYIIDNRITVLRITGPIPQNSVKVGQLKSKDYTANGATVSIAWWMGTADDIINHDCSNSEFLDNNDYEFVDGTNYVLYVIFVAQDTYQIHSTAVAYYNGVKAGKFNSSTFLFDVKAIHKHVYNDNVWAHDDAGCWNPCIVLGCPNPNEEWVMYTDHIGNATCKEPGTCAKCGATYYYEDQHDIAVPNYVYIDDMKCGSYCATDGCDYLAEWGYHTGGTSDCQHKAICEICHHEYGNFAPCAGGTATCTEKAKCATCGNEYGELIPHEYSIENGYKGADGHANACSCGAHETPVAHTPDRSEATETDPIKCTVCGYIITPATGHVNHTPKAEWTTDADNHWHECTGCEGQRLEKAAHIDENGDNKCDTCDYAMPAHDPDTPDQPDNPDTPDQPDNPDTPDQPDNPNNPGTNPPADNPPSDDESGLGAGAIVGIVCGSVAVVGIGGFALFWFVIKKKSFADLIAVFKKK